MDQVDPSGRIAILTGGSIQAYWYIAFCKNVCDQATKLTRVRFGGGGVICKDGIKCVCLFPYALEKVTVEPGKCLTIDACGYKHETQHAPDVDCPKTPGIRRPGSRISPEEAVDRECKFRKEEISCVGRAITELKRTNKNGCNDNCIETAEQWVAELRRQTKDCK